jgi:NAD+ diphosphatase
MFQDIFPHIYHNEFSTRGPNPGDRILSFSAEGLLCRRNDNRILLPTWAETGHVRELHYLFSIDDTGYFLHEGQTLTVEGWQRLATGGLRDCDGDETLFAMAAGESLWRWLCSNRFCGRCGQPMDWGTTERNRVCPTCGNTVYPKICPAVIVAVYDGDRLLLTRYKGRPFKRYALVAGFNEIGESIEDTVRREVLEETGLHVKDLQFYKSQPWVFTDSLLMGFYAKLDGSDAVTVQEEELSEATWFHRAHIPADHSGISLTGEMIEQFRNGLQP